MSILYVYCISPEKSFDIYICKEREGEGEQPPIHKSGLRRQDPDIERSAPLSPDLRTFCGMEDSCQQREMHSEKHSLHMIFSEFSSSPDSPVYCNLFWSFEDDSRRSSCSEVLAYQP